ncbi:hypothetical protein RDABS01_037656 [Bienertia sinuspersici]
MKKLYRKGQVHPSPSPSTSPSISSDQFSLNFLPATILTLVASLSSEDKQVLAYLLSCSSNTPFDYDPSKSSSKKHPHNLNNSNNKISNNNQQHPPSFSCYCFTCYTSYWARWDSSPNRQLIHEIIDAFEDNLLSQRKKKQGLSRKEKRKNNSNKRLSLDNNNHKINDGVNVNVDDNQQNDGVGGSARFDPDLGPVDSVEEDGENPCDETGEKQGSVRKIVNFIGERIWGSVWDLRVGLVLCFLFQSCMIYFPCSLFCTTICKKNMIWAVLIFSYKIIR